MKAQLEDFAHALLSLKTNETEKAVACMWFETYHNPNRVFTIKEIISALNGVGLITSPINGPRLSEKLKKHKKVTFDRINQVFTLPAVSMKQLNEEFEKLLQVKQVKIVGALIDPALFDGTREYFPKLTREINGSFEYGFFDGAAVLLRRMIESLLIEAFIFQKLEGIIKKPDNSYKMLDDLIGLVKSGHHLRLSRGMDKILDAVKELGDTASHHRFHIAMNNDFDWLKSRIGKLLSELIVKSGIR